MEVFLPKQIFLLNLKYLPRFYIRHVQEGGKEKYRIGTYLKNTKSSTTLSPSTKK